MKKVFPIFSILLLMAIASCGGEYTKEQAIADSIAAAKYDSMAVVADELLEAQKKVELALIIGEPIKLGDLLVAQKDFPSKMKRNDAKKACASLGPGWRLPTKDELNIIDQNKDKIGGFTGDSYWSSPGLGVVYVWHQNFFYDLLLNFFNHRNDKLSVRAVRDF